MNQDVVIVGGGPAGLSAALTLGRGRKKVLLCDGGVPRNAAADQIHNFVTRDGTPPREFRRIAREQLGAYPSVSLRDAAVVDVAREGELLRVRTDDGAEHLTRRVLLTVGVVDEVPDIPGARGLWGHSIAQCPYCHGWEVRGLPWGVLAPSAKLAEWALLLTGWTDDLVVFSEGADLPPDVVARLSQARVRVEPRRIRRLLGETQLEAVELEDGARLARRMLFMHPRQRPAPLVERLGLALDEQGFVRVDDQKQSSMAGVHVAGDATTPLQAAIVASSAGVMAAALLNHALTVEAALQGGPSTRPGSARP
ncbi:NAD(P)/FAD-dependent oxidoreductase [Sorangium sp. So ce321]|uniref:NAD(P)/FAD-dependent oxidoreductase n=1 Tax=Sorangium sp. So ce321 TaxID=3133300 RepID=UPI003F632125